MSVTLPLNGEPLITLTRAAGKVPGHRGADRLHPATLTRWILIGVKGPAGGRVKLEAVRMGSRWLTSEAAVARFSAALTPPSADSSAPSRSPAERRQAAQQAEAALIRAGA